MSVVKEIFRTGNKDDQHAELLIAEGIEDASELLSSESENVTVSREWFHNLVYKGLYFNALDELRKANKGIRRLVASNRALKDRLLLEQARSAKAFRDGYLHGRKELAKEMNDQQTAEL